MISFAGRGTQRNLRARRACFLWILLIALCIVERCAAASEKELPNSDKDLRPESLLGQYEDAGRRDPFDSLEWRRDGAEALSGLTQVRSAEDLRIEGLVLDPAAGSFVMVNGVILREGESQEGVKALQVQSDGVIFEIHGARAFKPYDPASDQRVSTEPRA